MQLDILERMLKLVKLNLLPMVSYIKWLSVISSVIAKEQLLYC